MTIRNNLLQRIHEREDCPICMDFIKIEEKVYTEPCNHVYCIRCLVEWFTVTSPIPRPMTCPMDRLKLVKVHIYNPIEADIKVVETKHIICKNICRERHGVLKVFTDGLIKILSGRIKIYNHMISMSNSLKNIYEIFTEESFQILLDMDPNDSKRGFDVFVQLIDPMKSVFISQFISLWNTCPLYNNMNIIEKKVKEIECYSRKYDNNDELIRYLNDLKLFNKIYDWLIKISYRIPCMEYIFRTPRSFNEQNTYDPVEMRHFYKKVKIAIPHYRESILLNLNYFKFLILQMPKLSENIEYLDVFSKTPESCLLCLKNKNEDLICGFDKCHHKICKDCEQMFDLRNIICPIENQMMGSRLISNTLDMEKILINACEEMNMEYLESSFKMIEFTKNNYFKILTGDRSRLCQLNVPTFISFLDNEDLKLIKLYLTNDTYSLYYSLNEDRFSEEIKLKLDKHFEFVKTCNRYWNEIWTENK